MSLVLSYYELQARLDSLTRLTSSDIHHVLSIHMDLSTCSSCSYPLLVPSVVTFFIDAARNSVLILKMQQWIQVIVTCASSPCYLETRIQGPVASCLMVDMVDMVDLWRGNLSLPEEPPLPCGLDQGH